MRTEIDETWLFSEQELALIEAESELISARDRWAYHLSAYGPEHHQTKHDRIAVEALEKRRQRLSQPDNK